MALDFPANPTEGQTELAENGVTYTYECNPVGSDSCGWIANSQKGLDERYVNITGDDMTGDLTLGIDKITLDADAGNASFAEGIIKIEGRNFSGAADRSSKPDTGFFLKAGDSGPGNRPKLLLTGNGSTGLSVAALEISNDDGANVVLSANYDGSITAAGNVLIGGALPNAPNITLAADGKITAAGVIKPGFVYIDNPNPEWESVQLANSGTKTLTMKADGSATFSSTISALKVNGDRTDVGTVFSAKKGGVENASIMSDGSAEFAGGYIELSQSGGSSFKRDWGSGREVTVSLACGFAGNKAGVAITDSIADTTDQANIKLYADGTSEFKARMSVEASAGPLISLKRNNFIQGVTANPNSYAIFDLYDANDLRTARYAADGAIYLGNSTKNSVSGPDNSQISLNADGSITAAGNISSGTYNTSSNTAKGTLISSAGKFIAQRTSAQGSSTLFEGYQGNTNTVEIFADGSAEFAGDIISGNYDPSGGTITKAGTKLQADGALLVSTLRDGDAATDISFRIKNPSNANAVTMWGSGKASFAGTVTANGSVLTRANGTTLDLGDRAEKVDAALGSLKTALASISDFAQLKAALVTALADI